MTRFFFLLVASLAMFLGGCETKNFYNYPPPGAFRDGWACNRPAPAPAPQGVEAPPALVPAPALAPQPQPAQAPSNPGMQAPPPPPNLNTFPVLNTPNADVYVKSIPDGQYWPIWNTMGIGENVKHPQVATILVLINNKGRFLATDASHANDGIDWQSMKVIVYANEPGGFTRKDANNEPLKVASPLWVGGQR